MTSPVVLALAWVSLFAAFVLPGHYPPWTAFQQQLGAAVMSALVLVAAFQSDRREGAPACRRMRWPILAQVALGTALVPLLQFAAGHIRFLSDAVLPALYLAGFALSQVAGAELAHRLPDGLMDGWAGTFLCAALASMTIALGQWLDVNVLSGMWIVEAIRPGTRPYSNLAQPNHLATLLVLGLIGAGWLFQQKYLSKPVFALAGTFLCFGIAMTQSRTGWLAMALVTVWIAVTQWRSNVRVTVAMAVCGLALLSVLMLSWNALSEALYLSGGRSLSGFATSARRDLAWTALLDAVQRHPWVGYGWNQVSVAHMLVAPDHPPIWTVFQNAHNLVLDLLLWNGVPLGLLLAGILGWWAWRQARSCRDVRSTYLLCAIAVVFVHAMVEFPLDYAYFLFPVGLMMGAVEGLAQPASGFLLPRWWTAFVAAIALLTTTIVVIEYVQIEEDFRRIRFASARIGSPPSVDPKRVWLVTQPSEFIRFARTSATRGMSASDLAWMRSVAQRAPSASVLMRYALAAALNRQPQEARLTLVRLCKLSEPVRCDEARELWGSMSRGPYPELALTPFP